MDIKKSDRGFFFVKLGTQTVWLNAAFVPFPDAVPGEGGRGYLYPFGQVAFPVQNARAMRTERGNVVIRPDATGVVVLVEVVSGYRGTASITSIEGGEVVWKGESLHSPRGNLGCTCLALCNVEPGGFVTVHGTRTGRRVDNRNVAIRVHTDGRIDELSEDELTDLLA